jgi:hypothetical protein
VKSLCYINLRNRRRGEVGKMVKHLQFSKIQAVERRGALMLVWFLDNEGNMYDWCPKWEEVEKIFSKQINVERFNKPESEWLNRFAKTAQEVVQGAQRIESAYKVSGSFKCYEDQQLVIELGNERLEKRLIPGFEITLDFLDNWLRTYVELFVVNNIVIRIREYGEYGSVEREYPKLDELPF